MRSAIQEKWAFVLLGDDSSGKTTFQKMLVKMLCNIEYQRLPSNQVYTIEHSSFCRLETIFLIGRSIQEFTEHPTPDQYFADSVTYFKDADICILSSHISDGGGCTATISQLLDHCKRRKYNVAGVFFSNAETSLTPDIALLNWDKRIIFSNPTSIVPTDQEKQLRHLAQEFVTLVTK